MNRALERIGVNCGSALAAAGWGAAALCCAMLVFGCGPSEEELEQTRQGQLLKMRAVCESRPGCKAKGSCTPRIETSESGSATRTCVVATREDCLQAEVCRGRAMCSPVKGEYGEVSCEIRTREDCLQHDGCEDQGECSAVKDAPTLSHQERAAIRTGKREAPPESWECVVASDEDCALSRDCKEQGECTATPHERESHRWVSCAVGSDADCRSAPPCRAEGACSKAPDRAVCIPVSEEDCKASEECKGLGRCILHENFCYSATQLRRSLGIKRQNEACSQCAPRCEARRTRAADRRFDRALDRGDVGLLDAFVGGVVSGASIAAECQIECKAVCDAPWEDYAPPEPESPPVAKAAPEPAAPPSAGAGDR
jgi:hypothetical protein